MQLGKVGELDLARGVQTLNPVWPVSVREAPAKLGLIALVMPSSTVLQSWL